MANSNKEYYLTEVDKQPSSIYCMHDLMGEIDIAFHKHIKGQFLYTEGGVVHVMRFTTNRQRFMAFPVCYQKYFATSE